MGTRWVPVFKGDRSYSREVSTGPDNQGGAGGDAGGGDWRRGAPDNQGGGSSPGDGDGNAGGAAAWRGGATERTELPESGPYWLNPNLGSRNGGPAGVPAADPDDNGNKEIEDLRTKAAWAEFVDSVSNALNGAPRHALAQHITDSNQPGKAPGVSTSLAASGAGEPHSIN